MKIRKLTRTGSVGPMNKPDKGLLYGSCNRTACQAPGATWYNHSTQKYYCTPCADMINEFKPKGDSFLNNLGHDLCTPAPEPISIRHAR